MPPYAPELDPDELAWAHVKSRIGRPVSRTKDELKTMVRSVLRRLQPRREIVSSFIHAPTCAYAAA